MKRTMFDVIFIILAAAIVIVLNQFGLIAKYPGFSLIPLLLAYYIGRLVERKTKAK